jgi:hypothetical protein
MNVERLIKLDTPELQEYRRTLAEAMADLKSVEKNLKVLVTQNQLDKTPTLLSGTDTGAQERLHAAEQVINAMRRARTLIDKMP